MHARTLASARCQAGQPKPRGIQFGRMPRRRPALLLESVDEPILISTLSGAWVLSPGIAENFAEIGAALAPRREREVQIDRGEDAE